MFSADTLVPRRDPGLIREVTSAQRMLLPMKRKKRKERQTSREPSKKNLESIMRSLGGSWADGVSVNLTSSRQALRSIFPELEIAADGDEWLPSSEFCERWQRLAADVFELDWPVSSDSSEKPGAAEKDRQGPRGPTISHPPPPRLLFNTHVKQIVRARTTAAMSGKGMISKTLRLQCTPTTGGDGRRFDIGPVRHVVLATGGGARSSLPV